MIVYFDIAMYDPIFVDVINSLQNLTDNVELLVDITIKGTLVLSVAIIKPLTERLVAKLHLNIKKTDRERRPRT